MGTRAPANLSPRASYNVKQPYPAAVSTTAPMSWGVWIARMCSRMSRHRY